MSGCPLQKGQLRCGVRLNRRNEQHINEDSLPYDSFAGYYGYSDQMQRARVGRFKCLILIRNQKSKEMEFRDEIQA